MQEKDKKEFLVLMAMLAEAFKEDISKDRAKIYFDFLKPYSMDGIRYAFKRAIKELRFFPKIAELLVFLGYDPHYPNYAPFLEDKGKRPKEIDFKKRAGGDNDD